MKQGGSKGLVSLDEGHAVLWKILAITALEASVAAVRVSVPAQLWACKPLPSVQQGGLVASLTRGILAPCEIFYCVSFYMRRCMEAKLFKSETGASPFLTELCGVWFVWAGLLWSFSALRSIAMFQWCIDFICGNAIYYCHQLLKKKGIVLCGAP